MNDTGTASAHANPMGTDGFEFIEYTAPNPELLGELFEQMGFSAVARHRSKDVVLYRQGRINVIVNREADRFRQSCDAGHGTERRRSAHRGRNAPQGPPAATPRRAPPRPPSWWSGPLRGGRRPARPARNRAHPWAGRP